MRIVKPSFEIWPQKAGMDGVYRQIERVGRVCYKSEDHQTADSARPFVERMIGNQHYAMLEHGTVYLTLDRPDWTVAAPQADKYIGNKFSVVRRDEGHAYVTTNLRVLVENGWQDDLKYMVEPTDKHERRVTVHFTTQIAITREFNRHRVDSVAEQSTRYCNYSKKKFGNEISVNLPTWVSEAEEDATASVSPADTVNLTGAQFADLARKVADGSADALENWLFANAAAERAYLNLIDLGRKPQEARVILPLDTNTELVHTAFVSDWWHFFDLRALGTTGQPHPDAKALAEPLRQEFIKRGWLREGKQLPDE